jgi:hypothetical protein
MKTGITFSIEKALARYDPDTMCNIKINKFRGRHAAFGFKANKENAGNKRGVRLRWRR